MSTIKDTIARIGRIVRQSKVLQNPENQAIAKKNDLKLKNKQSSITKSDSTKVTQSVYRNLQPDEVRKYKPLYQDFQRKTYREFLEPLDIPSLKTFNERPAFDSKSAKQSWAKKTSQNPRHILEQYMQDRQTFQIMISTLIDLTPSHLKNIDYTNAAELNNIILQQDQEANQNKTPISAHCFHEIPPIPSPLTRENFSEYIFKLTHTDYSYKNSSSLQSGIIPQILLYTHRLTSHEFKDFRSTQTYNCLIHYFGYVKNQSTFARELLLVMKSDGHAYNIDTINTMMKILTTHANIRGVTSTYGLALKYLQLSSSLNIPINLGTYNYIYSTIGNVHLKEDFLKMMHNNGVPIPKAMMLKIVDDFAKTTTDYHEVINFIETDLGYESWSNDSKFSRKVVYSQALNAKSDHEQLQKFNIDEYTLSDLLHGIRRNEVLKNKAFTMIRIYTQFLNRSSFHKRDFTKIPRIYHLITRQLMDDLNDVRKLGTLAYLVRCIIYEATQRLDLPVEIVDYGNGKVTLPENYKIMSKIIGGDLQKLEAKITYINNNLQDVYIKPTSILLDDQEIEVWNQLKSELKMAEQNTTEFSNLFKLIKSAHLPNGTVVDIPHEEIQKILAHTGSKISAHRNRERVIRISEGSDEYIKRQMIERGLMKDASQPT
ncbi:ATPase expression protein 3 [Spathaspora sp. JA1]|nr:ATPase expression protein 3 [Spathaspora sp. JA1]